MRLVIPPCDLRLGLGALFLGAVGVCGDGDRMAPCVGDGGEHVRLVARVALDAVDEVGDEIGALLEQDVDLRPAVADAVTERHEIVLAVDRPCTQRHDEDDYDRQCHRFRLRIKPADTGNTLTLRPDRIGQLG